LFLLFVTTCVGSDDVTSGDVTSDGGEVIKDDEKKDSKSAAVQQQQESDDILFVHESWEQADSPAHRWNIFVFSKGISTNNFIP
jgi:hypothetical protein